MLNGIGYGRVSGKYGSTNPLATASAEIRYAVAVVLGLGPLVM